MCVLLGFGTDAICPYLIMEATRRLRCEGVLNDKLNDKQVFDVSEIFYLFVFP
jgi:glutamate synthase (NADPH/NADH)